MSKNSDPHYPPGQVLRTGRFAYWHIGIVTDRWYSGEQIMISCSAAAGAVKEEPLSVFRRGGSIEEVQSPSNLPAPQVLARARRALGKRYSLLAWNCEHFVYYAFGLDKRSPQLAWAISLILGAILFKSS